MLKFAAAVVLSASALFIGGALAGSETDFVDCKHGSSVSSKDAVAACTRLIKSGKETGERLSEIYTHRCKHAVGSNDEALADCSKAIQANPKNATAHYLRGNKYENKNLMDRAFADWTTSIKLDPVSDENALAHYGRYAHFMRRGNLDVALEEVNAWAKREKTLEDPYRYRAELYEKLKRYDAALKDRTKVIEMKPDSPHAYMDRADLYRQMGKLMDALEDAEKAVTVRPDNGLAYLCRAKVLDVLGRRDEAMRDYRKALSLDNDNRGIKEQLKRLGVSVN